MINVSGSWYDDSPLFRRRFHASQPGTALRARGVDVITALDAGMIEREDAEHLDYAMEQGRVLCSFNVGDFYRLHSDYLAQGKPHAGIILMRQQYYSVGEQMRRILRLMASKSADEMRNGVEFLSAWG